MVFIETLFFKRNNIKLGNDTNLTASPTTGLKMDDQNIPYVVVSTNNTAISSAAEQACIPPDYLRRHVPSIISVAFMPTYVVTGTRKTLRTTVIQAMLEHISPNYQHCQFIFTWDVDDNRRIYTTFTTNEATSAQFTTSIYRRAEWKCIQLNLAPAQRSCIFKWCLDNRHVSFNTCGFYWNFLPCVPTCFAYDAQGTSFFCAEQVATALKFAKVAAFANATPCTMTPDAVFTAVSRGTHTVVSTGIRFDQSVNNISQHKPETMSLLEDETAASTSYDHSQ